MPIRLIAPDQFRRMPWKNGGGETIEIIAHPEGADLASFAWRISMARVATDGPFSMFEGVDRTLSVIDGTALELVFEREAVSLDLTSPPYRFAGDIPVTGRLPAGPIVDLNVMTRRTACRHQARRLSAGNSARTTGMTCLVLAHRGDARLSMDGTDIAVPEGHAALVTEAPSAEAVAAPAGILYLVEIDPA